LGTLWHIRFQAVKIRVSSKRIYTDAIDRWVNEDFQAGVNESS